MKDWKRRLLAAIIAILLIIVIALVSLLMEERSQRINASKPEVIEEQQPVDEEPEEVMEEQIPEDSVAVTIVHEDGTEEVVYTDEEIFKVAQTINKVPTNLMVGELAEIANDGGVGTVLADLVVKCVEHYEMQPEQISMEFTGGTLGPETSNYTIWVDEVPLYITLWISPYNFEVRDGAGCLLAHGPEFKYENNNYVESYVEDTELYIAGYKYDCVVIDSYTAEDVTDEMKSVLPASLVERIETFPEDDQQKLFSAFYILVDGDSEKASAIRVIGRDSIYVHRWSWFERCIAFNYDNSDRVMFVNDDTGLAEMAEY